MTEDYIKSNIEQDAVLEEEEFIMERLNQEKNFETGLEHIYDIGGKHKIEMVDAMKKY
jgi:hypothetical protein